MGLLPNKIIRDLEYRRFYSVDASGFSITPDAVYMPSNVNNIRKIIRYAINNNTTITCRGGGTGLAGGALNSGIILDMKLLNNMELNNNVLSAGSGVYRRMLDKKLNSKSRFFGPNPSVGPYCTVGGMIANNAAGSHSIKYGCTIDNLIKITIIDGRDDIVTLPDDEHYSGAIHDICSDADLDAYPHTKKNSSGYRLDAVTSPDNSHKVIAASEGTLGVIISADLKTHAKPSSIHMMVISYADKYVAAADCIEISKLNPSSLEIMGPGILHYANVTLFVEFDVPPSQWRDKLYDIINGKILLYDTDAYRWWSRRSSALSRTLLYYRDTPDIIEDAAVPLEKISNLIELLHKLEEKSCKKVYYYGHVGDGNIHVRHPADRHLSKWYLENIININGTITAEHGDGIGRTSYVLQQYGDKNYDAFLRLKKLFDPYNIFNPGKIIYH
ncbi:MAG: FAD-binding oxidoreductase [Cenarchaeum sp. SB0665_bin_23]|nr:FAD-binding oxidoreductase [Cenarchaeum sp. SB0667_bin_13]MXY61388.1 FAD-binding oxidoreductase [Cenarchaeum sp. SB0665_bin_23]MXZ93335.1 FAD-binding oxidoreductase [Cenarchaeum sp. SB0666_bin_15]MYB47229.1 FAD-binding oxidoreductase [Cenarchaeum sp. SB0662_bin_33]MYC79475.1 FAD-binding oxidoreductase [Cenarchaeum sp. SB0661_bin_35]MYD58396.1 FAD-binding oxidoreductase [Cenarchaeum sp. SB0678_bin_8]MYJ27574.1 FAD-binding oxidoreductase [Cenarchaeum sp. SB0672_bin_9]